MTTSKSQPKPDRLPAGTVVLLAANLLVISGATALYAAGLAGAGLLAGGAVATAGAGAAVKARRRAAGDRWRTINGRRVRLDDAGRSPPGARRFGRSGRPAGLGGSAGVRAEGLPPSSDRRPVRRGVAAAAGWLGLPTPARWRSTQPGRAVAGRGGLAGGGGAPRAGGPQAGGAAPGQSGARPGPLGDGRRAVPAGRRRLVGLGRRVSRARAAWRRWGQPESARRPAVRPQPGGDPPRRKPSPRPRPARPTDRDSEIDLDLDDRPANPASGQASRPTRPPTAVPQPQAAPPDGTRHTTGGAMPQTPMLQMMEAADQMVAVVTRWEPEGMLEVLDAYKHWPDLLHRLGEAWKIMHRKATDGQHGYPLHPVVSELIEAVQRHQEMTANAAEEIAPTAHALHRRQIEALRDRRNAMWDHRANRAAA